MEEQLKKFTEEEKKMLSNNSYNEVIMVVERLATLMPEGVTTTFHFSKMNGVRILSALIWDSWCSDGKIDFSFKFADNEKPAELFAKLEEFINKANEAEFLLNQKKYDSSIRFDEKEDAQK